MTTDDSGARAFTRGDAFYTAMRATEDNFAELEAWVNDLGTYQELTAAPTGTDAEGREIGAGDFYLDTPGGSRALGRLGDWVVYGHTEDQAAVEPNEAITAYYTPHTADLARDEHGRWPVWLTLVHTCGHVVTALVWNYTTDINALSLKRSLRIEGHPLSPHMLAITGAEHLAMLYETPLTRSERRALERAAREIAENPHTAPEPMPLPNRSPRPRITDQAPYPEPADHRTPGYPPAVAAYEAREARRNGR